MRVLGLGFTNPGRTGGVWVVCMGFGGVGGGLGQGLGGCCESG